MSSLRAAVARAVASGDCYAPRPIKLSGPVRKKVRKKTRRGKRKKISARKEVTAVEALTAILVALTFTYFSVLIIDTVKTHAARPKSAPYVVEDWRPPINKCPQAMPLWDCIKNAEYAKHE